MKFEWYNEEDGDLKAPQPAAMLPEVVKRRWPMGVVLFLAVIGIAVGFLFQQIQQRSLETVANVEGNVLATHQLVWQSGREADLELFASYLSGSDPNWAMIQQSMVAEGLFFDRPELGLHWQPAATTAISLSLSADLSEATLISPEQYQVLDSNGLTQTITLWQTSIYRQGPGRWLYAPPKADYWGGLTTLRFDYVNVTYPTQDEALVEQMAQPINALLEQLCQTLPEINCPSSFKLELFFSNDPGSLLNPVVWYDGNRRITLPTPALVGRPADPAAFEALLTVYEQFILSKAITNVVGWKCCEGGLFFQALLQKQLFALGLPAAPLLPTAYEQLLSRNLNYDDVYGLWAFPPSPQIEGNQQTAQIVVDFLLEQNPELAIAEAQRQMVLAANYADWLNGVVVSRPEQLTQNWTLYLFDGAYPTQNSQLPTPLPQQDIIAMCQTPDNPSIVTLLRFEPSSDGVSPAIPGWSADYESGWTTIYPAPAGQGFWLVEHKNNDLFVSQWQNGQSIWELSLTNYAFYDISPLNNYLTLIDTHYPENYWRLLDLNDCRTGDCTPDPIIGRPIWSPNEKWMAVGDNDQWSLTNWDGQVKDLLSGESPVWLDNETLAYLKAGATQTQFFIRSVADSDSRLLFHTDDLASILPAGQTLNTGWRPTLVADPAGQSQLFVALMLNQNDVYVYRLNWLTNEWTLLFNATQADPHSLMVSPDGRWLTLTSGNNRAIVLYDTQTEQMESVVGAFGQTLWSPDGRWLLAFEQSLMYWIAPGYGYTRPVPEPILSACGKMIWVGGE